MFADKYAQYYDLMNRDKSYEKEIKFVYRWAKHPKSILDIGCGTADYWRYYPRKVTLAGIERSYHMVQRSIFRDKIQQADIRNSILPKHPYDCVTALFDVMNYIPEHSWWGNLPIKKGGYFIFDIWDKEKVDRDGFSSRIRNVGEIERYVWPRSYNGKVASMKIFLTGYENLNEFQVSETHLLYIWREKDIRRFARECFDVVEIKKTRTWQCWYKLRRK
jgi:SAM-dependent methyltransferase